MVLLQKACSFIFLYLLNMRNLYQLSIINYPLGALRRFACEEISNCGVQKYAIFLLTPYYIYIFLAFLRKNVASS